MTLAPLIASGLVNPWLAGGVGLAGVPIVIHLLSRRRFRHVDWAAMTFLLDAERRNRRRVRFEEWLLVALRCLAMALLALLVARPFAQPGLIATLLGGAGQSHRVIVVDDSASLSHTVGARADFEQLRESLERLLGWLGQSAAGDSLTILRTSAPDQPIVEDQRVSAASIAEVKTLIGAAKLNPVMVPADPVRAIGVIAGRLSDEQQKRRTDVYILSDFQASEWLGRAPEAKAGSAAPDAAAESETHATSSPAAAAADSPFDPLIRLDSDSVHVYLLAVGDARRDNVAVEGVEMERPQTIAGFPAVCRARIANFSGRATPKLSLGVTINGAPAPPVACDPIEPGKRGTASFEVTIPEAGVARVEVGVGRHDGMPADDTYAIAVDAKPAISVLLVDGDPSTDPLRDETHFLRTALAPPGVVVSGIEVKTITPAELDVTDLHAFDCVVLCNVGEIDTVVAERLGKYVERGGGLAIMLGDRVDTDMYNARLLRGSPSLLPAELRGVRRAADPASGFGLTRVGRHPVTALFPDGSAGLVESVRFRAFVRTRELTEGEEPTGADATPHEDVRVLARFTDEQQSPALIERKVGAGRVLLFTSTADMAWHDWPRAVDGSYVVTMLEMVQYLARRSDAPAAFQSGDRLEYAVSADEYEPSGFFHTPDGDSAATQRAKVEQAGSAADASIRLVGPPARQLGTYQLELTSRQAGPQTRPLCVNLARVESDLTAASQAELAAGLGDVPYTYLPAGESFVGRGEQSRRELWPAVCTLLVVVLMSEQALAWWFGTPARRRAPGDARRSLWRRWYRRLAIGNRKS